MDIVTYDYDEEL